MTIRKDESSEKEICVDQFRTREDIREYLMGLFIREKRGIKLRYYIENVADKRIYIERPGRLNKGCDFVILVEDLIIWKNGNDKPPRHDDLISDLTNKKGVLASAHFVALKSAIHDIYELKPYSDAIRRTTGLPAFGWKCRRWKENTAGRQISCQI